MSSNREKAVAAFGAGVIGLLVGYATSARWGFSASFGVYLVMIVDNILDRLDNLKEQIEIISNASENSK